MIVKETSENNFKNSEIQYISTDLYFFFIFH